MSLLDRILYKTVEATDMSNITYLPSGLGAVKAAMRSLARKKKDWNIEILENEKGCRVIFEDEFSIFVPRQYWDDFSSMFDGYLASGQIGLEKYLKEAMEEDLDELREEIKPALTRMFNIDVFRKLDYIIGQWRSRFGVVRYLRTDTLVRFEDKLRDIQKLVAKVYDVYGEDRGNLELLLEAIRNGEPLNTFQIFRQRDFLYGTRVFSHYEGARLTFEGTIDMSYMMAQSIVIDNDEDLLDNIQDSQGIKVVKNVVYPVGDSFTPSFFEELQDAAQGSMEGGPGSEEYGEDSEGEEGPNRQRMVPRGER